MGIPIPVGTRKGTGRESNVVLYAPTFELATSSIESFTDEQTQVEQSRQVATAWAALTGHTVNSHINESVGHAFKAIADEQKHLGRIRKGVKFLKAGKWRKALRELEWGSSFLGFVEHDWKYAADELFRLTLPDKKPHLSMWCRVKLFFWKLCTPQWHHDDDNDEEEVAPLTQETMSHCQELAIHAMEQRAKLLMWSYHLVIAQMHCYQQQIAQDKTA